MEDALFGVATRNFVVLASDTLFRNNVLVTKSDHIRYTKITDKTAVISAGNQGDCERTIQYVVEALKYEELANSLLITEKTFTSVLQNHIYTKLRKDPVQTMSIVGGVSEGEGCLFLIDQYGATSSAKYMATGYAAHFFLSGMDLKYRPDLTEEEVIAHITDIYEGVKKRMVINYGGLHFCVISRDGIRELPQIQCQ
ncbi:2S proteasome subunit beta 4 [Nematocida displodere]|uniref:2S proteasome subunit beta 4 n=1 Tax=Nematocida displodere TaxID=1805483 RepID=A0A177EHB1_9MICR|nr:2S proteasome subunit beta 4 [Nematocida displodere]